ncbi:minor tail protein [Mycobacterium phage MS619]
MAGISLAGLVVPNLSLGATPILKVSLGAEQVWPSFDPVSQTFTTTGSYTFNIPSGCMFIDVVLIGGGGGGQGMGSATAWGQGGRAGAWNSFTLVRGVDIPMGTLTITGSVGVGGTGGAGNFLSGNPGGPGGSTTATAAGMTTRTAAGGAGGNNRNLDFGGQSPGDITLNGRLYQGGAVQGIPSSGGNPPGGGGSASTVSLIGGGAGARGQAWFYAY